MHFPSVQESIESAFAEVQYPGDDRIADHMNCPECEDVREHFRGATWRGHTVVELQQYHAALTLFTPTALQYFIPAFMLVSLDAWAEAVQIPFSILRLCLPSPPESDPSLRQHREGRFAVFTQPQREAIAAYLQEWAVSDSNAIGHDEIPAALERLLGRQPGAQEQSATGENQPI